MTTEIEKLLRSMATVLQGVQQTQAQLVAQGPNATIFMGKETRRFYAQTRYGMCSNLNYLNPRIYQTLTKLTTPELPNTKTYQELVKLLKQHLTPQSSFIHGLRDSEIRERLLQLKAGSSFEETVQVAQAVEIAKRESSQMQKAEHEVNAIRKSSPSSKVSEGRKPLGNAAKFWGRCLRCGKKNHIAKNCLAKNLKYTKCDKKGHLQNVCLLGTRKSPEQKQVVDTSSESGEECKMELDTGAAVLTISETRFKELCPKGKIPEVAYSLKLANSKKQPIFIKPRPVPYALRPKVEAKLKRLEELEIIEKIEHSTWGTPIVPIIKKDGSIRVYANYKATINKEMKDDQYPIPKIEDIFNKMNGDQFFCTLDIHQAYLHMPVDDESAMMQAISTHLGVYKVKPLMFEVKTAPNA
ncbi:uncharacterized protein LOC105200700 [Solenopsis invicta]|uniref:uncharacterized protein LOC105200700 n=1 Tax=Solenopsis invicta TaxID=13686 RepID=UPI000595C6F4|nr:uncharacterized protein LOC105200700 [Solenopsis invicta]